MNLYPYAMWVGEDLDSKQCPMCGGIFESEETYFAHVDDDHPETVESM